MAEPEDLLSGASLSPGAGIDSEQLRRFWSELAISDDAADYLSFESAFMDQFDLGADHLSFRPTGWEVKATSAAVKAALAAAVLAVGLSGLGAVGVPAAVIAAVVPMLFDVNQVKLTPSEDHLLATLTLNGEARGLTAEQLHERLPDRLREQVTELQLRDFLDRCFRAGSADYVEDESGERSFHLYPQGKRRFRISFV